jgi:predicted nucleotidyltransferase
MGANSMFPIDIYVPEEVLEDAKNTILAISLEECEPVKFD